MAEKLKIISLGGLNEIGKNMTVYEYGKDIIVVDVGMGFPDDDMYGIDVVIPDFTYLIKNKDRIRGIFLTHGHEDHIGAMPYLHAGHQRPHLRHPHDRRAGEAEAGGAPACWTRPSSSPARRARRDQGGQVHRGVHPREPLHRRRGGLCHHTARWAPWSTPATSRSTPPPSQGGMIDLARLGAAGQGGRAGPAVRLHQRGAPGLHQERAQRGRQPSTPCSRAATSASSSPPSPPTWTASSRSSTWPPATAARWPSPAAAWRTP